VLVDVFSGFRGLAAADHFIHLVHEDCRQKPFTADLSFYDPGKVKFAFHDFFSFLTRDEFAELHRKVLATVGAGTHAHNFVRGARMINALTALAGRVNWLGEDHLMDWYTHFLAAMQKNDPQFLTEHLTPAERLAEAVQPGRIILDLMGTNDGLGLSFESFSRSLALDYQPAINCPPGMCRVGFLKEGQKGFVEIAGPFDDLRSIRLVFPLFGDNPREVLASESPSANLGGVLLLRRFLLAALSIPESEADRLDAAVPLDNLAPIARKCGAITLTAHYNGKTVLLNTVNPEFWVSVAVLR
jgi:hypothetical protein